MCAALIAVHTVFMLVHVVMWKLKEFACGASRQENAQKMKEKGMTLELIAEITGLSTEEIEKL